MGLLPRVWGSQGRDVFLGGARMLSSAHLGDKRRESREEFCSPFT
jgi:hypothetical protein